MYRLAAMHTVRPSYTDGRPDGQTDRQHYHAIAIADHTVWSTIG